MSIAFFDATNTFITIFGYPLSYIELTGTLFGLVSVYYATMGNILTWSTGLINIVCFFAIFYQVHLYSDMFLQIYFFLTSIYGWMLWKTPKKTNLLISKMTAPGRIGLLATLFVSTWIFGYLIQHIHEYIPGVFPHPASYPYLDTFIAIASIIATILLAQGKIENWSLWILVDSCAVFVYYQKHTLFICAEYVIFFFLACYGLYNWQNSLKHEDRLSIG